MAASVRPVRAAIRVLRVLASLNARTEAGAAELARDLRLSRATTYRLLETLVDSGFAEKDPTTAHYTPTETVKSLSCGFDDEQWIRKCALPVLSDLGSTLLWPIAIATLAGPTLLVRASTDIRSPLAVRRFPPGRRIGLVSTASGLVYLAYCGVDQRETLLDILGQSDDPENTAARERASLRRRLTSIRERGYAQFNRKGSVANQAGLAVPVLAHNRILASLSIRFAVTAVSAETIRHRFLPDLRAGAAAIGAEFESVSQATL